MSVRESSGGRDIPPERWARIERALDNLLDRPPEQWPLLLVETCGGDDRLEAEVRALLERRPLIERFLESPPRITLDAAAADAERDLQGRRLGAYRVLEEIARGGMGWVYAAYDTLLDRRIALKVLPPDMAADAARLARFEREAKIVAALSHPNIVTIHSIEEADGIRFLTMELVDGVPLDRVLERGALPLERFLEVAVPLTEAVCAAHERGVVHRDLKPANVMQDAHGRIKILDFGIAKPQDTQPRQQGSGAEPVLTAEGIFLGTVHYTSPEQLQGGEADARSDLFSLGVMFFELLGGRRPFCGASRAAVVTAVLRDDPPRLCSLRPDLPKTLERTVARCLEKDPAMRYQHARDLLLELETLSAGSRAGPGMRRSASIAVLPFSDMSPRRDQGYFCEGIAEELINALGRIVDLRVASRTSSFKFKDGADIREIGRLLGVSRVLEGSVRKAGDRIRVTVQLINAADGYRVWSERYDREARDIFAVQEEISERVAESLELTLDPRERRALRQVATRDVEAYEYYLRGRRYFYRVCRRSFQFARQLYERAIELDESYALAYVGLAECCAFLSQYAEATSANLARAEQASRRAVELDPDLAETHASRGLVLSLLQRHREAEACFATATRLDPQVFEAWYFQARACQARGEYARAARLYERAGDVRSEDYEAPRLLLKALTGVGAPRWRVEAAARRALDRVRNRLELHPDDVRAYSFGAPCLLVLGQREEALAWSAKAEELEPDDAIVFYNKACLLCLAGQREQAMRTLERAVQGGFVHRQWVELDPELVALRADGRFAALLDRMDRMR